MEIINKFENGKIYKIYSKKTDKYYIGSTCLDLNKRFVAHKSKYNEYQKGGSYLSSFEILKFNDAKISLLLNYKCNTQQDLEKKEAEFIFQNIDYCVNILIPGKSISEIKVISEKNFVEKKLDIKVIEYFNKWFNNNIIKTENINDIIQSGPLLIQFNNDNIKNIKKIRANEFNKLMQELQINKINKRNYKYYTNIKYINT